ncbi:hypothetical protein WJX79_002743 [Trebouxia sp. C0005]
MTSCDTQAYESQIWQQVVLRPPELRRALHVCAFHSFDRQVPICGAFLTSKKQAAHARQLAPAQRGAVETHPWMQGLGVRAQSSPSDHQQGCYLAAMPIAEKIPSSPDQDGSSMEQWGCCMKGMPAARAVWQRPPVSHSPTCHRKMGIGSSGLVSTTAPQTAQIAQTLHIWVYDLDRPVPADAARAAPKSPQKTKGRGAKPKYIYTTAEEAIAKRRKRNRDTATQSYYNRKQRVSMLANEMAGLKEENAALRTILCVLERGSQADKGWLREQLSAGRSPSSILQELQQTSSWLM